MSSEDPQSRDSWASERSPGPATLFDELYAELHRLAAWQLRGQSPGHELQTTDLLDEAFLKLASMGRGRWKSRQHFLAEAARTMRSVLVDHARFKGRAKRSAPGRRVALDGLIDALGKQRVDLMACHEALLELTAQGRSGAEAVAIAERVLFAGMTCKEIAAVLGVPLRTTERRWNRARAWLRSRMS